MNGNVERLLSDAADFIDKRLTDDPQLGIDVQMLLQNHQHPNVVRQLNSTLGVSVGIGFLRTSELTDAER